ncbi:hypothetical protein ACFHW0_17115 [Micromonospora sp. LOL_025]|uniref:hypothetical protein n=1 Tax=Micromonospora sp. LOL_025 TaxID=3345413 RepID=UPI003A84EFAA
MRFRSGLGIRIDNRGDTSQWSGNVRIDSAYVSGASSHAAGTYGVDGLTIGTGNNAILIENCQGVDIAAGGGTISGGGEVRLAERTEFPGNRDITLRIFILVNSRIVENPCADNLTISNVGLNNSTIVRC